MKTILLVGNAGSGKTWVMKQLLWLLETAELTLGKVGMFYFHRDSRTVVLGKYDGTTFEGSDKLSMAVMRDVKEFDDYARAKGFKFVVCEGDRFMNSTFIIAMQPYIIKITDDGSAGRKRRGSSQTERQLKSIATRVSNVKADMLVEKSSTALKVIKEILDGKRKI